MMQRYFLSEEEYFKNILVGNNYHHVKNVMRMQIKDKFIIKYNKLTFLCQIVEIDQLRIYYEKISQEMENNDLPIEITLIMGIPKNDKMDLILQKSTELGVSQIFLTFMERSIVKYQEDRKINKMERYSKIVKEAAEQSRRNSLPIIEEYKNIRDIDFSVFNRIFVCYENENLIRLKEQLKDINQDERIAFIIGPEGGISENEIDYFKTKKAELVSLGKRILRCETAPLYFLSVIGYELENK